MVNSEQGALGRLDGGVFGGVNGKVHINPSLDEITVGGTYDMDGATDEVKLTAQLETGFFSVWVGDKAAVDELIADLEAARSQMD